MFGLDNNIYLIRKALINNAWLDQENLLPGQNWKYEIRQAIQSSDIFIALLSSHSVSKTGFVQKEMRMALDILDEHPESDIYLIPVRLEECNPTHERLKTIHMADLSSFDELEIKKLIKAIKPKIPNVYQTKVSLKIHTPNNQKFETEIVSDTLVEKVLQDFLTYWQPPSMGHQLVRYALCHADQPETKLLGAQTLFDAGIRDHSELKICQDKLTPDSAIRLYVANKEGERYETFVKLNTKIQQIATAFFDNQPLKQNDIVVESIEEDPHEEKKRRLNLNASLFEEKIGDNAMLKIFFDNSDIKE
jgi:hypothetical protein